MVHHRRRRRRRRPLPVHVAGAPSLRSAGVVGLFAGVEAVPEGVGGSLVERLGLGLPEELPVRGDAGVVGPEVARIAQRVPVKERRRRIRGVVVVVVVVVALRETDAVHFVVRLLGVGVVVGVRGVRGVRGREGAELLLVRVELVVARKPVRRIGVVSVGTEFSSSSS